jgi:hypothetical protein
MDILELLTRPGTYVLGLLVYIATFFTRKVTEMLAPQLKKQADANAPAITYPTNASRWWNEVVLYAIPVAYGGLTSLSSSEFFFAGIDGGSARFMFSCGVGWFSSFMYKTLKKVIRQKLDIKETISEVT